MEKISTIGLDIAKSVFQLHGVGAAGQVALRRQLRRSEVLKFFGKLEPCLVGIEACAGAHYWAREITALGHDVRLMPPSLVKPYVKRGSKSDASDAAGCCEAVTRPSMRFVPVKSIDQQAALMLHRARQLLVEQRTQLCNAIRAHMTEVGIVAVKGEAGFQVLLAMLGNPEDNRAPPMLRPILSVLVEQWRSAGAQIEAIDRQISAWHKSHSESLRLATIPQIGPVIASAAVATAGDATRFRNGRQFAAWLGLVPSKSGTGGKIKLGPITKAGDRYLRQLLVIAGAGLIRRVRKDPTLNPWLADLLTRMPAKQAAVAMANKLARIIWALLVTDCTYQTERLKAAA